MDAPTNFFCCIHHNFFNVVDIFQSQDHSTCYGMKANLTCITAVAGGLLLWSIDGNTVFTVGSGLTASFNQTVNGSTFVFVRGSQLPGSNVYTYTSTVSLDTNKAKSISCSDGILPMTFDVDFIGNLVTLFIQICFLYH